MKDVAEKALSNAQEATSPAEYADSEKQELVTPEEWESLLYNFEAEDTAPAADNSSIDSDDLWERLSSTRWIKTSSRVAVRDGSTVAQRSE